MADSLPPPPADVQQLKVLDFWTIYADAPNAFYRSFLDEALQKLRERDGAIAKLKTKADWERYRGETRQKLLELVGPFPEKTPLNPRITGIVRKDGFRMEKVIYESVPGFYVTAALYVPEGLTGKAPGIVYCSGHSDAGFRTVPYQTMILNLVKKGFVVLAFDPIGQGERLQYFDPKKGNSEFGPGNSTREHSRAGTQCFITGSSLARYMIWDGIRSVDYLLSRPEVDPARIGITGRSGGGTQSAYIAAFDERILAAAPENYLTTFEQLLRSRGPQDPEQNFLRGLARGFDQTDLVLARAPKPTLIVATTRDIFSIEGTRALHAEANRAYAALGYANGVEITVDDAEHTSTRKNREATYAFFRRHLNLPGSNVDEEIPRLSAEELRVTETGQVSTLVGGESVFTLNRREALALEQKREVSRRNLAQHLAEVKNAARRLSGYTPLGEQAQPVVFSGRVVRQGYVVEKYLLPMDGEGYAIPLLAFVPERDSGRVVLYFDAAGKSARANVGGEIEKLVQQGYTVVAPDVIGVGEAGPGVMGAVSDNPPRLWYGYVLLGKSMLGRQLQDVMRCVRFTESRFGVKRTEIAGVGRGAMGPLLLHAAALENAFDRVATIEAPLTYQSMVTQPRYATKYVSVAVPAALTAYDLPDLAALVAPRKLLVLAPCDGMGAAMKAGEIEQNDAVVTRSFVAVNAVQNLKIVPVYSVETLGEWLQ